VTTPVPIRNRLNVLEALRNAATIAGAAKAVGFTIPELRSYVRAQHLHNALIRLENGNGANRHPGFKPFMLGERLFDGAAVIVKREANCPRGTAQWRFRFVVCGHEHVMPSIRIRVNAKNGAVPKCPACCGKGAERE
jgi:hypothetical protein